MDVKSIKFDIYKEYTGVSLGVIQQLSLLQRLVPQEKVAVKVPSIPGYNDCVDLDYDVEKIKQLFVFYAGI